MARRSLKHMLTVADGYALWNAARDGWQVTGYGKLSHRSLGVEYHAADTAAATGARLGNGTCRVCGERLEVGAPRFMVLGDPGDNAWTMQKWYVHATPCVAQS